MNPYVLLNQLKIKKYILCKRIFFQCSLLLAFTSATFVACNNEAETKPTEDTTVVVKEETMEPKMDAPKDIVDVAMGSADHTTLVAAVKAAGLVETLKGAGPFTVFAPTNAAFNALPAGTVDGLLKPESKADLTGILNLPCSSWCCKSC